MRTGNFMPAKKETPTMAKLVIGKDAPKSFPVPVSVPTPSGDAQIQFEMKHLTSTEWATLREKHTETISAAVQALFDEQRKKAEEAYSSTKPKKATEDEKEAAITALLKPVKESELARLRSESSAEMLLKIAISWDLSAPMDKKNLQDMCDRYPGSAEAVFKAYNETREGLAQKN